MTESVGEEPSEGQVEEDLAEGDHGEEGEPGRSWGEEGWKISGGVCGLGRFEHGAECTGVSGARKSVCRSACAITDADGFSVPCL